MLENSAEPEVLMAQMSAGQLNSFSSYQSKLEVSKQNHLDKLIQNAVRDAGLTEREVTSFMRVRVVGLRRRDLPGEHGCDEGFITIWEPTDSQQLDLIEGKAYAISSLIPVYSNLDTLYLQAKGSTVKWRPLSSREYESFKPFFNPRSSTPLSLLGEIPFSSLQLYKATENSNYFLNFNVPYCKHLKGAAASVEAWASTYEMAIKKLRERANEPSLSKFEPESSNLRKWVCRDAYREKTLHKELAVGMLKHFRIQPQAESGKLTKS
ncbi:hypothetical protein MLD38_026534 [Melastoma candidum]|uniref:Uncharacterized protein n=1 Tax=Melastoma candidum TaxID=119954 RepID=A0ACB9NYW8_9MYRT|nr:hypothetical protein MLD38_026534 [Melastoma candidum]